MYKIFFEPNLPIRPAFFVGREEEIRRFRMNAEAGLYSGRTASSAILGEWGIGKSSLLLKFLSILQQEYRDSIGVDMTISEGLANFYMFAQSLLDSFYLRLSKGSNLTKKARDEIHKWRVSKVEIFGVSAERDRKYYLTSGVSLLQHNLQEIWEDFLVPSKIKQVIFFLDDLHLMPEGGHETLLSLRGLFQSLAVSGFNYSLVFTAPSGYFGRVRELAEPAVRFFEKLYLSEFRYKEVETLFTKDLKLAKIDMKISTEVIKRIYNLSQGHPYFVSFIGRCLLRLVEKENITIKDFEKNWPQIFHIISEEKFREDTSGINGRQLQLLIDMAMLDKEEVSSSDLPDYAGAYFTRASKRNLLIKLKRGEYKLYHPLFKEYLKAKR